MSYATQQDMITRFGEEELVTLTNSAPNAESIDEDVLALALTDADAEINSYIGGRYKLPLATTPSVLVLRACDIARKRLYRERLTETVKDAYDEAVAWLLLVSRGAVVLDLGANEQPTQPTDLALVDAPGRHFTADSLKGFVG